MSQMTTELDRLGGEKIQDMLYALCARIDAFSEVSDFELRNFLEDHETYMFYRNEKMRRDSVEKSARVRDAHTRRGKDLLKGMNAKDKVALEHALRSG